jgi:methionyl-tRNA formyltransferase
MVFPGVPMPQATISGREVEVLSVGLVTAVDAAPSAGPPGTIAEANERGVTVRTGDGAVIVGAVQALAPDAVPVTGCAVGPFLGWTGVGVR